LKETKLSVGLRSLLDLRFSGVLIFQRPIPPDTFFVDYSWFYFEGSFNFLHAKEKKFPVYVTGC